MAIPNGDIYLLANVPLSANYDHTIDFMDKTEQYGYFYKFQRHVLTNYSYIRKEREYIAVELPLSDLDSINYLLFRSADGERLYYAFVTNKTYVNPTTSHIFYDIDVLQTYMFEYEWRASYIKQAHVDRWTAGHLPIYSKTDEGLDYGTDYSIESAHKLQQSDSVRWLLVSMIDIPNGEGFTIKGFNYSIGNYKPVESAFACCLVPILTNPALQRVLMADTSQTIEYFTSYAEFVKFMLKTSIGKYIRSITLMPYNPFIASEHIEGETVSIGLRSGVQAQFTYIQNGSSDTDYVNMLCIYGLQASAFKGILARAEWDIGLENTLPTAEQWAEIKANPRKSKRDKRFESKLLCAPYRYNLLTDWRGSPVILKNEYMTTDKIEVDYSMALSYNVPFRYWVRDYKRDPEGRYTSLSQPLAMEFPIISDAYYAYMLENKNTIQANLTNTMINAGTGIVSGAISGGGIGGVGGAVYGAVTGAVSGALSIQSHIRSENAKQADLKMQPDNILNSNDSAFNIIDGNVEVTFYRMRICCENEEIIAEIFNMTGYKVHRVDIPNTRSRVRFNYIQTVGANIVGSFNQDDLLKIKAIYDNGVTIWHYSDTDFYPLDYSYENIEVNLI